MTDRIRRPRGWNLRKGAKDYGKIDYIDTGRKGGIASVKSPDHQDFSNNPDVLRKAIEARKLPKPDKHSDNTQNANYGEPQE